MTISRNVIWRYPNDKNVHYPACDSFPLQDGLLLDQFGHWFQVNNSFIFTHLCAFSYPVLSPINLHLQSLGCEELPLFVQSWYATMRSEDSNDVDSRFRNSVYPIVYSVSSAAVISVFLTAILFTKHYLTAYQPTLTLRMSCLLGACQLVAIYIFIMVTLANQLEVGQTSVRILIDTLLQSTGFNVVYLIAIFLALVAQVDVIQKMFPRKKERRVIQYCGYTLCLVSQIIWGLSTFLVNPDVFDDQSMDEIMDDTMAILPAFMYLLRISISMLYSSLVNVYLVSKRTLIFKKEVLLLTILMVVGINTSIAFFIADISNVWVSELSEVFNLTCYLVSNITTWEWLNRMAQLERHEQKGGVLGRQQFFYDVDDDKSPEKLKKVNSHPSNQLRPSQTHIHHQHHPHQNSNIQHRPNANNNSKHSKAARKLAQQFNLKLGNYDRIKTELQQYRTR
ncbi:unnamed protein product [Ambrosiozyma monospora]|uniref:pH-response regulator protein palH/RIM21 n=1 Tax=Ambrosiozyma monospora TaxID=43982 RepID=A0A9W6Z491_AMBMO|nr:unnamed protein product [Ambrosiozyma monospora]